MKAILSLLLSASVVGYTFYNLREHALPWLPKVVNMCFNPKDPNVTGQFRVDYTGYTPKLDSLICSYVNLYQQPLHDILGLPISILLMSAFGTAYALMAIDGTRHGFKKSTLLGVFPLFGLLSNFFGAFTVFGFIFLPLGLYYRKQKQGVPNAWKITLPEAYGTLVGVILGYGVPSAILASPLVAENSRIEQELLSIWLVLPIFIVPFIGFGKKVFECMGSPFDKLSNVELKERMRVAEGKDAVERTYLFLGVLNLFGYLGSIWFVAQKGIHIGASILLLLNAPEQLPADLTFTDLGQLLSTRIMLVSYLALGAVFLLWAFFQGGILAGLVTALITPIVGPGAAVSFFAYYRESLVQDITTDDPEAEAAALQAIANAEKRD